MVWLFIRAMFKQPRPGEELRGDGAARSDDRHRPPPRPRVDRRRSDRHAPAADVQGPRDGAARDRAAEGAAREAAFCPRRLLLLCVAAGAGEGSSRRSSTSSATGYGTFQSHNQKVLANAGGIFMTHIRTRNEPYTAQQWRLSRSTDGGKTFATIYEATHGTHPPCIETDEHDNVYLVRSEFADGNAYLHTFLAADGLRRAARVTPIPRGAAQKFAHLLRRRPQAALLRVASPLRRDRRATAPSAVHPALPKRQARRDAVPASSAWTPPACCTSRGRASRSAR